MKKILLILFTVFLMAISFFLLFWREKKLTISIAYTSDLQGFITPHEDSGVNLKEQKPLLLGGSAVLAPHIKKQRKLAKGRNKCFFLVDTGNFFTGQSEGYFFKGSSIIEIMNSLGYDALAIGPQDFAFGMDNIRSLAKFSRSSFLSANMIDEITSEPFEYIKPYIIKQCKGIKIGIIGVTSPLVFSESIKDVKISDPILSIRKYVPILKNEGVKLIVVLSSLGFEEDKRLAQEVNDINVIIGGNDRGLYRPIHPFYVDPKNKTVIVCTLEKGIDYMCIDIVLDSQRNVIRYKLVDQELRIRDIKPAIEIESLIEKYENLLKNKKKEEIAYNQGKLSRSIDRESSLGSLVADILRNKTKAEIALVSGLQSDLKQGKIIVQDVYNILPIIDKLDVLDFNLAILELTGEQIKEILEVGVSYSLENGECIVQVSGLKYTYDLKRKKWDRIVYVMVNDEKLDLYKTYKVAVNGYLAAGLGGYYKTREAKKIINTGLMDFDVLAEYIKTHSPITAPPLEGRIVEIE